MDNGVLYLVISILTYTKSWIWKNPPPSKNKQTAYIPVTSVELAEFTETPQRGYCVGMDLFRQWKFSKKKEGV